MTQGITSLPHVAGMPGITPAKVAEPIKLPDPVKVVVTIGTAPEIMKKKL